MDELTQKARESLEEATEEFLLANYANIRGRWELLKPIMADFTRSILALEAEKLKSDAANSEDAYFGGIAAEALRNAAKDIDARYNLELKKVGNGEVD